MKKTFTSLSAIFLLAICTQGLYATTWYVKLIGSPAWADKPVELVKSVSADNGIYNMINTSNSQIDTLWIAAGTYYHNAAFPALKANRVIFGGFAGTENAVSERTLFDADGNGLVEPWEFTNPTVFEPSATMAAGTTQRAVVLTSASTDAVVDGFTFQNYHHTADATSVIFINGQPTGKIRNTILRNSSITLNDTDSRFINGIFTVNSGEAINCLVEFCKVEQKNPDNGGADGIFRVIGHSSNTSSGRAIGCVSRGNKVISARANAGRGGGFAVGSLNTSTASAVLINSVAYNNYSSNEGGGILLFNTKEPLNGIDSVINCTVVNNVSGNNVGAGVAMIAGGYMYNTVAWGNTGKVNTATDIAFMKAGALATPNIFKINNISDNHFKNGADWQADNIHFPELTTVVELTKATGVSIAERPSNTTDNGTDLAPRFMAPTAFQGLSSTNGVDGELTAADILAIRSANWMPDVNSPLINAGKASWNTRSTDLLGAQRIYGSAPDLGALEVQSNPSTKVNQPGSAFTITQTADEVHLSGIDGRFDVSVFGLNGKLFQTGSFHENAVVRLPGKGMYLLRIVNAEFYKTVKIVL